MTTRVIVVNIGPDDVGVNTRNPHITPADQNDGVTGHTLVHPGQAQTFYVHAAQDLVIIEAPRVK